MAGSVTGNLGSENITLRNMATEDTLSDILTVLQNKTITDKDPTKGASGKIAETGNEAKKLASSFIKAGEILSGIASSAVKIVRNLDTNINNVSYTFSTVAGELRVEGNKLSRLFGYAAESVAQLQEQQNTYSRMLQVGGTVASEFDDLRIQAATLKTDLGGMSELADKFSFSLKVGSSTVGGGLKKLSGIVDEMSDDTIRQYGRLGILPQKISESLLMAAEAQGGFGDVIKKYGGDAQAFNKGMLKSSQELNIFATAIGSNSKLMMDEAAKANQDITNRLFMRTLNDGEKAAARFLQAFTGNYQVGLDVMKSLKGGITTETAGLFQSLKGFTGMGNQMENFMSLVSKGADPLKALSESGLLQFAKDLSEGDLQRLRVEAEAQQAAGNQAQADFIKQQLVLLTGLKDADPSQLAKMAKEYTSATADGTRAIDSFTQLQNQQTILAKTTANVNRQLNRLGLTIATSMLKGTNLAIDGAGKGKDAAVTYFNQLLEKYGLGSLPSDIAEKGIDQIEEWVDKLINFNLEKPTSGGGTNTGGTNTGRASNLVGTTISGNLIGMNDQITYKDKTGKIVKATLNDLLNKPELLAQSESFKGRNNRAETLALGAALQKNITTLSAITAGDDDHEKHQAGAHPAGRGLDFAVDTTGKDPKVEYERAEAAIRNYMENVLGLKKGDYFIKNELDYKKTGGTGPHMHVEFSESASTQIRDKFKMDMRPTPEVSQTSGTSTQVSQNGNGEAVATDSYTAQFRTVNNNVTLIKPDWWDVSASDAQRDVVAKLSGLSTRVDNLATEINNLARMAIKV